MSLNARRRSACPGWSIEHRLFTELGCTVQTQQPSEAYALPQPGGKGGNPTNIFDEEKNFMLPSSCHGGSSLRKPEPRKQNTLTGMCKNFCCVARG